MPCALTVAVSALTVAVSALTVAMSALTVAVSALTVAVSALRDTHEACVVIVWPDDPSYILTDVGGRSAHKSRAFRGDGRAADGARRGCSDNRLNPRSPRAPLGRDVASSRSGRESLRFEQDFRCRANSDAWVLRD